jgi:O-antigen ligase
MRRTPGVDLRHHKLRGEQAHNTFLGTAAELGLPGLVLFVGLLLSTGRALRRAAVRARRAGAYFLARIANALLVSLAGWSVGAVFLTAETFRLFWIAVGLSLAVPKLIPAETSPDDRR